MAHQISSKIKVSAQHNIHKNINGMLPKVDFGGPGITKQGAFTEVTAKPRITTGTNHPGSHVKESPNALGKTHAHKSVHGGGHVSQDSNKTHA